jgi:hypothetical protein
VQQELEQAYAAWSEANAELERISAELAVVVDDD